MINKYLAVTLALVTLTGMIMIPGRCIAAAAEGLEICFKIIIPSLLPFFICSKILIKSGFAKKIGNLCGGIMRPLFNVNGSGALALIIGVLSGYPVGAKCAVELYENGACTKEEAQRLICFCNNSGPVFIIGSVAAGMLVNKTAGIILYLAHLLSALTVGVIFRFYKLKGGGHFIKTKRQSKEAAPKDIFTSSAAESAELILLVCGFIIFFSVFLIILQNSGVVNIFVFLLSLFGASAELATALFYSAVEMVSGVGMLCAVDTGSLKLILISAAIAWGGVSVMLQVFGVMSGHGFSKKAFISAKAMQSVFAGVYTSILLSMPWGDVSVFSTQYFTVDPAQIWAWSLILTTFSVALFVLLSFTVSLVKFVIKL